MLLELRNVDAFYGQVQVLRQVSLTLEAGEVLCLLGRNGAGKTTALKAIMGLVPPRGGQVLLDGEDLTALAAHEIPRRGIGYVPQGRRLFSELTVMDNLRVGLMARDSGPEVLEHVLGLFPLLRERLTQRSGTLSGGEQQMLALARALISRPRLLMLDEPSLGLAPTIVRELFATVRKLNEDDGLTVLVVEQNATIALDVALRAYVLEVGKVAVEGTSDELRRHEGVRKSYLGY
jgi:branched-chain amino acid transport system ATP-binding protein